MKIEWPVKGKLQQGMVFSNCLVPGYDKCDGWGLVITARCDLANEKVPVLNYLPIVRFEDWIARDGRDVVLARALAEEGGSVSKLLDDMGAPESVLLGTDLPDVLERLLEALDAKKRKSFQVRCDKASARHRQLGLSGGPTINWLREEFPKLYASTVKELMTHRLAGYYFLASLEPNEPPSCYVVMLRQIGVMSARIATRLLDGITAAEVRNALDGAETLFRHESRDDVAMPIGVLASPYIEHLLQTFSYLLSRIGLPNTEAVHINRYASPGSS